MGGEGIAFRAFVAIPLPDGLRDRLAEAQERLRSAGADVKWAAPENLHLTLKFLGNLEAGARAALSGGLRAAAAAHAPFDLEARGAGAFPERGAPRVVWAGCGGAVAALAGLARDVERAASAAGFSPESRPYSAHLTLGRVRSQRNAARLRAALGTVAGGSFGVFRVDAFVLYRSDLSPRGPAYTAVERYALKT